MKIDLGYDVPADEPVAVAGAPQDNKKSRVVYPSFTARGNTDLLKLETGRELEVKMRVRVTEKTESSEKRQPYTRPGDNDDCRVEFEIMSIDAPIHEDFGEERPDFSKLGKRGKQDSAEE